MNVPDDSGQLATMDRIVEVISSLRCLLGKRRTYHIPVVIVFITFPFKGKAVWAD